MFDLSNFYQSREWRKLLDTLKTERVNEDGQLICEYCGKPIVRKYDIIGHHKIHLTDENVNDYEVSLNPDNVELVHHRCHNYIHNKLGYSKREVYLVYGAPLSGHREYAIDNMEVGDLLIDIERIWECISGSKEKPPRIKSQVFKVRDALLESVKYRAGKWNNCYIVGGYPLSSERERLVKELGAREIYIEASKEECLQRLEKDDSIKDKDAMKGYIDEWFARYNPPSAF